MMDDLALQLLTRRFDQIDERIDSISIKVDEILQWRWKLAGMATVIGFLSALFFEIIMKVL